jgi:hypothetical protein
MRRMIVALLIGILLAALVYWLCIALGLPVIVGVIAAILVLLACLSQGNRFFHRP